MIENPPSVSLAEGIRAWDSLRDSPLLQQIQDDYLYWDKVKYKSKGVDPQTLWSVVKIDRRGSQQNVFFGKHKFNWSHTHFMLSALHRFDMHIGGNLGSQTVLEDTDRHRFLVSSLIEEAISSSQMEGASTTRKKAKELIQKEQKPRTKSEKMILNNFLTIKHIGANKNSPLTEETLLEIHRLMCNGTLDSVAEEGAFRTSDDVHVANHIDGSSVYEPPSVNELPELIADLCRFFNENDNKFTHPIIKAVIIHFMLAWIHPFTDGNGRTARALFYWYMLQNGYWLTEYLSISRIIKESKAQYEKAYLYTEKDELDLGYFITYHLKTMDKAFNSLKEYIQRKQKEVLVAARFLRIDGVNDRMAQILKIVNDDPDRILNIREIENRFDVSNFTARTDLKQLVKLGFLEIVQVNKIKQNFIRSSRFDQLLQSNRV